LLLLLIALYAAANLATALTQTFGTLMFFRFISGLPLELFSVWPQCGVEHGAMLISAPAP